MATPPSSPSPTKPPVPDSAASAGAAASLPAKPTPTAWSHKETIHLIQIYQDKWFANKLAHLKAPQWEEVAAAVAARSGGSGKLPPKTATQCRQKMEKLRKRFRSERKRDGVGWPYYNFMDRLEHGPAKAAAAVVPAPARPISVVPPPPYKAKNENLPHSSHGLRGRSNNHYSDDEDEDEDDYYDHGNENAVNDREDGPYSRSQSINYILQRPTVVKRFPSDRTFSNSGPIPGFVPRHLAPAKRMRDEDQEEEEERMRKAAISKMAGEMRAFSETYVGIEKVKMEVMKEAERSRLEMENKRMEMILESQRKIVAAIARALGGTGEGEIDKDDDSR